MTKDRQPVDDQRCVDVVEMLTAYLDHTLGQELEQRIDRHLQSCRGCRTALAQWRTVIDVAGRLTPHDVAATDPYVRERFVTLLTAVRRR